MTPSVNNSKSTKALSSEKMEIKTGLVARMCGYVLTFVSVMLLILDR